MANNAQPGVDNTYSLASIGDISELVESFEPEETDDTLEFKGSGGSAVKQWAGPTTRKASMVVANDPTIAGQMRSLKRVRPKTTDVLTVDYYSGASVTQAYTIEVMGLKEPGKSGDPNKIELDLLVHAIL